MIDPHKLLNPTPGFVQDHRDDVDNEQDYHDNPAVGNSDLKLLEKAPRLFVEQKLKDNEEEEEEMNRHIKMGTMVEQKLLQPNKFDETFIKREEMNTPSSPNQKEFVQLILGGESMDVAHDQAYVNSTHEKAKKLYNKLSDYIEFQYESEEKTVFDQDEQETMLKCINDLMSHDKATKFLVSDDWEETWTQLPMFAEMNNVFVKGLADRVVFDGNKAYLIDLKITSKSLNNFGYWFLRRKYYRQFAHYARLLVNFMQRELGETNPIVSPIMVVGKKSEPYGTIVRKIPEDVLHSGMKEMDMLMKRLKWHITEDKWQRRKGYYQDGIQSLDFDNANMPDFRL